MTEGKKSGNMSEYKAVGTLAFILALLLFGLTADIIDQQPTNYSVNVSGEPEIYKKVSFIAGNNTLLTEDLLNKTIRIDANGITNSTAQINLSQVNSLNESLNQKINYSDVRYYITYGSNLSSGTPSYQDISIGFKPTYVEIKLSKGDVAPGYPYSDGVDDGTKHYAIVSYGAASPGQVYFTSLYSIFAWESAGNYFYGTATMTDNGIRINWEKTGNPIQTYYFIIVAYK